MIKCVYCGDEESPQYPGYGVSDFHQGRPVIGGMGLCGDNHNFGVEVVAILSTTVLPKDGTYKVRTLEGAEQENTLQKISGVPHYVGHPDTKKIVEVLGAIPASTKLFSGLEPGESALCVPIKQGLSSRASEGFTTPHQMIEEIATLDVRVITRLK